MMLYSCTHMATVGVKELSHCLIIMMTSTAMQVISDGLVLKLKPKTTDL